MLYIAHIYNLYAQIKKETLHNYMHAVGVQSLS